MHVNDPFHKEGTRGVLHLGGDLDSGQVVGVDHTDVFMRSHVLVNLVCILTSERLVTNVHLIRFMHLGVQVLL